MGNNILAGLNSIGMTSLGHGMSYIKQREARVIHCTNAEPFRGFLEFTLITLASYKFRVLATIHFSNDSFTKYFTHGVSDPEVTANQSYCVPDAQFYDTLGEMANEITGKVKRELETVFPYLGMSTPNRLPHQGFELLMREEYQAESHTKVIFNDQCVLGLSLLFAQTEELDFELPLSSSGNDSGLSLGELELF
ncbi:MAG: hypothetical protein COA42_22590 [Alteromonadaceae bacterium]|nr:MAG: hypothetical protein COA42_22590 [Alteromonadaceae bacterium]